MTVISQYISQENRIIQEALPMLMRESQAQIHAKMEYRIEHGADPYGDEAFDDDADEDDMVWDEFFKKWCEDRLSRAFWNIWGLFKNDALPVYRVITAPENWEPDELRHPGKYWSWSKDAAQAHWGNYDDGAVDWRMSALINFSQINWPVTLYHNADPSYEEEREIQLKDDAPVEVLSFERIN